MSLRLRSVTVQGFRAFGAAEQTLRLPGDIAAVWGPNSKGKTSLAEAIEFLLTGHIARRELMSSTRDEFADALRNAHLPSDTDVYVSASIVVDDESLHEIKRTLTRDYAKRQDCDSRLEVDGVPATEADLLSFGLILSQPPLEAPVLAQHTLSYIFSVRPQDRATYFKTLLEVTDLDALRDDIAAAEDVLEDDEPPILAKFDKALSATCLRDTGANIEGALGRSDLFTEALSDAADAVLNEAQLPKEGALSERLDRIQDTVNARRASAFPLNFFDRKALPQWRGPTSETWTDLSTYATEQQKIDTDTQQLAAVFREILKIPAVASLNSAMQCPVCETEHALTPERVAIIRAHVADTAAFNESASVANRRLEQLSSLAETVAADSQAALPRYQKLAPAERRSGGFTIARIDELLGDQVPQFIPPWISGLSELLRSSRALRTKALSVKETVDQHLRDTQSIVDADMLRGLFNELKGLYDALSSASTTHGVSENQLHDALQAVIDQQSDTTGWQEFVDVAREIDTLRSSVLTRGARRVVGREFKSALRDIDKAKETVLNERFIEYSDLVQVWWERLRPEESTYFSGVRPRAGAKRTIDFKAGLSAEPDRSSPKIRDVISVFSQSQLHCLGLALFLARAEREDVGFIVLDDPVLSSDEDYRVHFNATVLAALIDVPIQVIVLTQDHATWEELETRYRHRGISTAQLFVDSVLAGSVIENTSDALRAKINRARSLARGGHPDSRKECGIQLRDAGERFCKEMLVEERRAGGEDHASLSDYDGKTLEWLRPRVDHLLNQDPSHPGKLEVFTDYVNRACHDNSPPGGAEMMQACGDIEYLANSYLMR